MRDVKSSSEGVSVMRVEQMFLGDCFLKEEMAAAGQAQTGSNAVQVQNRLSSLQRIPAGESKKPGQRETSEAGLL